MEPDGIDALLQRAAVDGSEPPTPIRMQPNPAAAPASAAATGRRTKKKTKAARRARTFWAGPAARLGAGGPPPGLGWEADAPERRQPERT